MTNPNQLLVDAMREVTAAVQQAIDDGHRSRAIDADDLVEVLLAIADRLDPPLRDEVAPESACPNCGERHADHLVRCATCVITFDPAAP